MRLRFLGVVAVLACAATPLSAPAQIAAPNYEEFRLDSIFPAGGRRGANVPVELAGSGNCNMTGAKAVLIDGPPGVTVRDLTVVSPRSVTATFVIAPDAVPGRRCVRVLSERSGLTNMLYFTVGRLPEAVEKEPNNDPAVAQDVALPVVVNGRVDPKADLDCYRFTLKQGQRLVAAVLAHNIDSHGQYKDYGYVDAHLELLDERGRVAAEAGDTLGLDPQLEYVAPADGRYVARVTLEGYAGFPQAVYRLVLGEVPLATSVFPPGGQRGTSVEVELAGPNVPPGTRRKVIVPADDFPLQHVLPDGSLAADLELPFVRGDLPERVEAEPNDARETAMLLTLPTTANGRFDRPGDADWYRVKLAAGQAVVFETTAHRFLHSPADTLVEVYDAAGKKLAENDDGFALDYVSMHDFRSTDSRLAFTAPAAGDYFVRVTDQGGSGGSRAVYRLTAKPTAPDFELYLYPDGVPVWGPGSTAAFVVKVVRLDGLAGDITLSVEGLPKGWAASHAVSRGSGSTPPQSPTLYYFLTLTAPLDAKPGESFPFRVVGRADGKGRKLGRTARPLTWYYTSDTGFFRITAQARVAVTLPQSPWLTTQVTEVSAKPGGSVNVPVRIHGGEKLTTIDLTADLVGNGVGTAMAAPQAVPVKDGVAVLPVKVSAGVRPGQYGITVGLRWRSDIRVGMPGPCTPLITLTVLPP